MAEKRYQVFVSSTYRDLVEERQKVAQVLQSMDCIPAGMELFPAIDEEQFEFIKKVIDDCDYYILILGGRYGSLAPDGRSYTEKEFDYAIERDLRVIAFVRDKIDSLSHDKRESEGEMISILNAFRDRVSKGRLVKFWSTSDDLIGAVAVSLQKTMKTYPAPGWIRDTGASPEQLLAEINELRKANEQLRRELEKAQAQLELDSEHLASGADPIMVEGTYYPSVSASKYSWKINTNWDRLFYHLGPLLIKPLADSDVNHGIAKGLITVDLEEACYYGTVHDDPFFTIRIQLEALGLVSIKSMRWQLTPKGKAKLLSLRLIERPKGE